MTSSRLLIGKISQAHGVKGLVKLRLAMETPEILNSIPVYTSESGNDKLDITLKNPQGKYWLAALDGVNSREAAGALKGTELWVDRSALPAPGNDEFYIADLVGLKAMDTNDEKTGTVKGIDNFGAGDLLEIQTLHGESFYLPFTKEFVPDISLEAGYMTVIIPEGLLEN